MAPVFGFQTVTGVSSAWNDRRLEDPLMHSLARRAQQLSCAGESSSSIDLHGKLATRGLRWRLFFLSGSGAGRGDSVKGWGAVGSVSIAPRRVCYVKKASATDK
jgi:hypothetical protein